MSVEIIDQSNGEGRITPREANRPAPMAIMNRIPLPVNNSAGKNGGISASPQIHISNQQSTLSGSYSGGESRPDLMQKNAKYHYEVPNLSSMLYEYTNREKDRINQSFQTGNYHSLRDLPRHLLPGNVSQWNKSKVESNLYSQVEQRNYVELQHGGGYFSKFEYIDDPFELFLEQQSRDRIKSVEN